MCNNIRSSIDRSSKITFSQRKLCNFQSEKKHLQWDDDPSPSKAARSCYWDEKVMSTFSLDMESSFHLVASRSYQETKFQVQVNARLRVTRDSLIIRNNSRFKLIFFWTLARDDNFVCSHYVRTLLGITRRYA